MTALFCILIAVLLSITFVDDDLLTSHEERRRKRAQRRAWRVKRKAMYRRLRMQRARR